MKLHKQASLILTVVGIALMALGIFSARSDAVLAYHEGPPFPTDFAYSGNLHLGSKAIHPEGATAIGLPDTVFGNTFDAVFANTIAQNDLRNGTLPFRDGAQFVAAFFTLESPADGVDATGELAFVAVMLKDAAHYPDTGGWGFEAFTPDGTRLTDLRDSCYTCHEAQASTDYVFSTLAERTISTVPASDNGVFLPNNYRELHFVGSKVITVPAAAALGLPADVFGDTIDAVYANREGWAAVRDQVRPFPVGSMFVAEFHKAAFPVEGLAAYGDLAFTAVMLKGAPGTGDDPSTGDWKFEAFDPNGVPLTNIRSGCIGCHAGQADNDFVFTK